MSWTKLRSESSSQAKDRLPVGTVCVAGGFVWYVVADDTLYALMEEGFTPFAPTNEGRIVHASTRRTGWHSSWEFIEP